MKNRTAKTMTITTTVASTIVVSVIGVPRKGPVQSSKASNQDRSFRYPRDVNKRHTNTESIAKVTTSAGLTGLASPGPAKGASQTLGRHHPVILVGIFSWSAAVNRRSRCGSKRGWPVASSHFSPDAAPQVGQRIVSTCFGLSSFFMALASVGDGRPRCSEDRELG